MTKRASRESARERKASGDMTDGGKKPPKKKSRYNLRGRKKDPIDDTEWIDDDTLISSDEEEEPPKFTITIDLGNMSESDSEDEYLPENHRSEIPILSSIFGSQKHSIRGKDKKIDKNKFPLKLTSDEKAFLLKQTVEKQNELVELMNRVSSVYIDNPEIPNKFKILQLPISDYMKSNIIKKLNVLSEMGNDVNESYKLRSWVDAFMRIPFGKTVPLPVQIQDGQRKCTDFMVNARQSMDSEIYGMIPAKTQILQIIAQWIVNPSSVGNVIALQGPMGVGKTSFARNAIAHVLKRPFEFFSLGGSSDIANFIGHSYTYEGSMWGRIVDCLMHAGTMNPVLYFDELDKVSTTSQGEEIISMLIHLTDRSQNSQFHDRYFSGVDFDMSQCLFVFSFNDIEKVHPILRDRMTVIHCGGYNEKDKTIILKQHIWPQICKQLCFSANDIQITEDAIQYLITDFSTHEKGVRSLIRTVETMMTRLNMLRVTQDDTMKDFEFYMDVQFPLLITKHVAETLLSNYEKKESESWKSMYT